MRLFTLLTALALYSCGEPEIIFPATLSIINIAPSHGSVDISPDVNPVVVFSHSLDDRQDLRSKIRLRHEDNSESASTLDLSDEGYSLSIIPASSLDADTSYCIEIDATLASNENHVEAIPARIESCFTTQ